MQHFHWISPVGWFGLVVAMSVHIWPAVFVCILSPSHAIFKTLALWADAFYKLKCPSVRLSVRVSVCLSFCSLLRYRLNVFLPPLPKVGCPIFLEIWNPWGKVMVRSGLTFEHLVWKWYKIEARKKVFFCFFCLKNMVETTLPDGLETSGRMAYR